MGTGMQADPAQQQAPGSAKKLTRRGRKAAFYVDCIICCAHADIPARLLGISPKCSAPTVIQPSLVPDASDASQRHWSGTRAKGA